MQLGEPEAMALSATAAHRTTDRPLLPIPASKLVNLAGIDLNLLVALDALLRERNVTIAGGQVGLSQPAMSRALGRLRMLFGDNLLVRSSTGLVLTRRAERLAAELPSALASLRTLIGNATEGTDITRTTLTLAMPDHQSLVLLPRLMDRLHARAPHVDLVTQTSLASVARRLEAGEIDLAIGSVRHTAAGFYRRTLYTDSFACLVREGHPVLTEEWNGNRFAALRHAIVASPAEDGFAQVYETLLQMQLVGRDPLIVPNATTAPFLVVETDIALVLPMRAAQRAAALLPLRVLEIPIELPAYEPSLLWHERRHHDADCAQLRAELASVSLAVVSRSEPN
jgi:DNA-binding transcriptional LysR family regulator